MSDVAVSINRVGKSYRINTQENRSTTLSEAIVSLFSARVKSRQRKEFWALQDVSFDVRHSEVFGIIGRNGAGKTTLLRILSRITNPTTGQIDLYGRVGSLLEVGTGFHPELTGRENIYLNGSILGMSRSEIRSRFDEIVAFAETEAFLDTPVKRYSSGMYVRLAFAVAAHLNPEILIVDEVLAVGDLQFQRKSMARMESAATAEGKTILFVSHNMTAVTRLCHRAALLDRGTVKAIGPASEVVAEYMRTIIDERQAVVTLARDELPRAIEKIVITTADWKRNPARAFKLGEHWRIRMDIETSSQIDHCIAAVGLQMLGSVPVVTYWSRPSDLAAGKYIVEFECDVLLSAGEVAIAVGISSYERPIYYRESVTRISIGEIPGAGEPHRFSGAGLVASFQRPEIVKLQ